MTPVHRATPNEGDEPMAARERAVPRETPPRRKIREAAERHGLQVGEMEWEPIGGMIEMQGRSGGWFVEIVDYGHATGSSWQEVVEHIDLCAPLWKSGALIG